MVLRLVVRSSARQEGLVVEAGGSRGRGGGGCGGGGHRGHHAQAAARVLLLVLAGYPVGMEVAIRLKQKTIFPSLKCGFLGHSLDPLNFDPLVDSKFIIFLPLLH